MKNTSCWIKDVPCKLQFEFLQKATNYFSEERKLGCGTFGQVYKGVLEDGEEIAVKIFQFMPQIDSQHFENEFGHLKRLRHENIVRLLGFCDESEPTVVQHNGRQIHCEVIHRALCLEYMPNGSLTKLLSEEYTGTNWSIRYRIIKGICEGLKYLHEVLEVPIWHLDLKPANILLDQGMVPKIADFGLSRLFGEENTIRTMSRLGTLGYCPPEFIDRGIISKKYDIFSLGVIIMKIIVGLEGYLSIADTDARGCFDYVYNNSRPNYAFVEPDYERVRCCIEIAINCMDKDRRKRPRISDVVSKLDEMDFFSSLQQHPAAKEAEGSTVAIHSQEEWNNQVDVDKLVMTDFPATWCSVPRGMAPVFADTAKKFTNETVLSESDQFYSASQAIRKILEISYGALQTYLKKLQRNPPIVKMPRASDLLNTHPLVGTLPAAVRDPLLSNTKETVRGQGTALYREGSRPTGIWLVSIGVVKWTSQRLSRRHCLDPILSHGSTLGLYEVLIGKPYICDMTTDSVAHCFFVETEKIEELRHSDPSIEVFLWQESALVLTRLLLSRIFEKMGMHEMRVLIAETSTMNIYIKGEDLKVEQNCIGILLEGFLKTENLTLITPPAVLLPSNADDLRLESSDYCHTARRYQVEARARIIFLEEAEAHLHLHGSASRLLLPQGQGGHEPARSMSHSCLLSWPESFRRSRGSLGLAAELLPGGLSSRALQLSMYGSMVSLSSGKQGHRRQRRHRVQAVTTNKKHSSSYPKMPSKERPLLSVQ